jgi:integrase
MFGWAVENELVPSSVIHGLDAVRGLERGRSAARETAPVKPVPLAFVEATIAELLPTVADMVRLQLHSGMRPGEVCSMRGIDLDMGGKVWLYRLAHHKMAYRGHEKIIPLGPKAQEIAQRRLKPDLEAFLFSPADTVREKRERDRQARRTKIYPCEVKRVAAKKRANPKARPGARYSAPAYGAAIRRACLKANVPHWHPHQLRHAKATEIRREFGLDAARAVLGHRSPAITEVYAELDMEAAKRVAAKLG